MLSERASSPHFRMNAWILLSSTALPFNGKVSGDLSTHVLPTSLHTSFNFASSFFFQETAASGITPCPISLSGGRPGPPAVAARGLPTTAFFLGLSTAPRGARAAGGRVFGGARRLAAGSAGGGAWEGSAAVTGTTLVTACCPKTLSAVPGLQTASGAWAAAAAEATARATSSTCAPAVHSSVAVWLGFEGDTVGVVPVTAASCS
mmetsp:Transcript_147102/g.273977  ORF Transcript_147102/g.273977 Transcript_147102/m.273977 type:complete len:205 (-) Transcript_147102:786-1400(-)